MKRTLLSGCLLLLGGSAYSQTTVTTITAGNGTYVNGDSISATRFSNNMRLIFDADSNLLTNGRGNNSIIKLNFDTGTNNLIAGSTSGYTDDPNPLNAKFAAPYGFNLDNNGNIYVADRNNNVLRKVEKLVNGSYGPVTTFAGDGTIGSADNTNPLLAKFNYITDVVVNAAGDIFVLDAGGTGTAGPNAASGAIRKINGITKAVTTLVPAHASYTNMFAIALDNDGNILFAEKDRILKADANTGAVTTIVGIDGTTGEDNGLVATATVNGVLSLAVHRATGNIYFGSMGNCLIRKIDRASGIVSTVAGSTKSANNTLVNGSGSEAQFNVPTGIAINSAGNIIYVGDTNNSAVRKIVIGAVLPVTLSSFTAQKQNNAVKLNWVTASEKNNSHFDILRSADGNNAAVIGTVSGNNNSDDVKTYSYVDYAPLSGDNYYQLRQVDFDGASELSKIAVVKAGLAQTELKVHASLGSTPEIKVFVYAAKAGKASLKISDIQGNNVSQQDVILEKGYTTLNLSAPLQKGVYVATLNIGTEKISEKFIIQ